MGVRRIVLGLICAAAIAGSAQAGWRAGKNGQPICAERDHLREYFLAGIQQDFQWLGALKDCAMLPAGTKIVIIEEEEVESEALGHLVKIRAFLRNASVVGYSLTLGMEETN